MNRFTCRGQLSILSPLAYLSRVNVLVCLIKQANQLFLRIQFGVGFEDFLQLYMCIFNRYTLFFTNTFCLFRLITVDEHGLSSPELDVIIVYCSLCSGHGTCDFDNVREDSVDGFQYATCNCTEHWTG